MATIVKYGNRYKAIVRKAGLPIKTKVCDTKKEAERWAVLIEIELDNKEEVVHAEMNKLLVSQIFNRYMAEVSPTKKSFKRDVLTINKVLREFPHLFKKPLSDFTKLDVVVWKEARQLKVSDASVNREWNTLSSVFTYAIKTWGLPIKANPFRETSRPKTSPPRNRRVYQSDIDMVLDGLDYSDLGTPNSKKQLVAWCFLFAIETAMRAGEILSLQWDSLIHLSNGRMMARLTETKNGESRNVPLSSNARELLSLITKQGTEQGTAKIVNLTSGTLDSLFRKHRSSKIADLHFHDTRHEALSRMAKIVTNPMDLAKISGHKDVKILLNVYYNPDDEHLSDLLG